MAGFAKPSFLKAGPAGTAEAKPSLLRQHCSQLRRADVFQHVRHVGLVNGRRQKEGKWEEDLLECHEEDEMWEVREEGGEEDYDSDDEPLQTSRQRFAAGAAAAASAGQ